LIATGDNNPNSKLVRTALKGFIDEWKPFIKGIVGLDKIPDWNRLWDIFTQEDF